MNNSVLDPDLAFALKVALRHAASKAVPSPELLVYFLQALQEKLTDDSHFIVVRYNTETSTGKLYFQYAAPVCKCLIVQYHMHIHLIHQWALALSVLCIGLGLHVGRKSPPFFSKSKVVHSMQR